MNARAFEVTAWHRSGAALRFCRTQCVTAELQGVMLSLLSIEVNYESPYVLYPLEGHTYIHNGVLNRDAAAKLAVDRAIS